MLAPHNVVTEDFSAEKRNQQNSDGWRCNLVGQFGIHRVLEAAHNKIVTVDKVGYRNFSTALNLDFAPNR